MAKAPWASTPSSVSVPRLRPFSAVTISAIDRATNSTPAKIGSSNAKASATPSKAACEVASPK